MYSVIQCVNGSFRVVSETNNIQTAIVSFLGTSQSLWNASDVITATVGIYDENLRIVQGYYDNKIHHDPQPAPVETPSEE